MSVLLRAAVVACACLLIGATSAAAADTATVSVTASTGPAQDIPMTLTVSGTTQLARGLWVEVDSLGRDCGSTAASNGFIAIQGDTTNGDPVGPGTFEKTYSYTPPYPTQSGSTGYAVCVFVTSDRYGTPDAVSRTTFNVSHQPASVTVTTSTNPTQDLPMTLTVSGSSQVTRGLWIKVDSLGRPCQSKPGDTDGFINVGSDATNGDPVGPGPFQRSYSYTPKYASDFGRLYALCAYVARGAFDAPDAVSRIEFAVAPAPGTATVALGGTPAIGDETPITVSGSTIEAQPLRMRYCWPDGKCYEDQTAETVGPGPYSRQFSITPSAFGPYSVSALLPNGSGSASFTVRSASPLTPADGARGVLLNPTFSWDGAPGLEYALILSRAAAGRTPTPILQLQRDGYADFQDADVRAEATDLQVLDAEQLSSLKNVATFSVDPAGNGRARLLGKELALPPGHYAWSVVSEAQGPQGRAHAETPARTFTVLGPALTRLQLSVRSRAGSTSKYPGTTTLRITTTPFAHVTIKISHHRRQGLIGQDWGRSSTGEIPFDWTCSHPGGRYKVVVTASDQDGRRLTRSASVQAVSKRRCTALRARERAAKHAHDRAVLQAQQRARRIAAKRRRERQRRFETNCRAIGGTPVVLVVGGRRGIYCRAPYGGLLNVPL